MTEAKRRDLKDEIRVYRQPNASHHYVWGGDSAGGRPTSDASSIQVIDCDTGDQCLEYEGRREGTELGELAFMVGTWYNHAFGCFENNNDQTPNNHLLTLGYPHLYYQRDIVKGYPVPTDKVGWNTNLHTRFRMVRQTRTYLRDGSLRVYSTRLLDQMEIFARNHRGKFEAIQGAFDDLIFGYMIAAMMYEYWWEQERFDEQGQPPLVDGEPAKPDPDSVDQLDDSHLTREERLGERALDRLEQAARQPSFMDAMI